MTARILGTGVVAPGALGVEALAQRVRAGEPPSRRTVEDFGDAAFPAAARMTRLDRMALAAARQAVGEALEPRTALVFATGYGELAATGSFLDAVAQKGPGFGSPRDFSQSVHHAAAGQLSIALKLRGLALTQSCREVSGEAALEVALALLHSNKADRVLVVAADERSDALDSVFQTFGTGLMPGEGAAAVLLGPEDHQPGPRLTHILRAAHPVSGLRFPTSHQDLEPLLRQASRLAPFGSVFTAACGAEFDGAEAALCGQLFPEAESFSVGKQLGLHPGAGVFKVALAARGPLAQKPEGAALCEGLAMGGQQVLVRIQG